MRKLLLAITALLLPCGANAADPTCTAAPTCESLGYTQTTSECSGKKIITCPFDQTKIFCGDSAMVGEIRMWPTSTPPKGWKLCDGSSLSRTTYSKLFGVIGTTYNDSYTASGSFKLPNLKGRVPVGVGKGYSYTFALGETGGAEFVQLSSDQIPDHQHIMPWGEGTVSSTRSPWGTYGSKSSAGSGDTDYDNYWYRTSYMYGRSAYRSYPTSKSGTWKASGSCDNDRISTCMTTSHENRMPFLVVNFIIFTGVY